MSSRDSSTLALASIESTFNLSSISLVGVLDSGSIVLWTSMLLVVALSAALHAWWWRRQSRRLRQSLGSAADRRQSHSEFEPNRGLLSLAGRDDSPDDPLQGPRRPLHVREPEVLRRARPHARRNQRENGFRLLPQGARREIPSRRQGRPRQRPAHRHRRRTRHTQGREALRPGHENSALSAPTVLRSESRESSGT